MASIDNKEPSRPDQPVEPERTTSAARLKNTGSTEEISQPGAASQEVESIPSASQGEEFPDDRAGSPRLQARRLDQDFRQVLTKGLTQSRRSLVVVAIFSLWVNLLILGVPIYLFNISDRVLTSRSRETLLMLSTVIVGAIVAHVVLDMIRRFLLMRIAVDVETRLGPPVVSAAAHASQNGSSREFQVLGDLQSVRNFITGPVLLTMLDAPVAPFYLLTVFLIHPDLGWIVTVTGVLLLIFAVVNQKLTAVPFARATGYRAAPTFRPMRWRAIAA